MKEEKFARMAAELRKRLIIIVIIITLGAVACFIFIEHIRNILLLPGKGLEAEGLPAFLKTLWGYFLLPETGHEMRMIYLTPAEALMANLRLAVISSIVVTLPVLLYQLAALVLSTVRHRRGTTIMFTVAMYLLFVLGLAFAYCVVLPFALNFFLGFGVIMDAEADFSITFYISFMTTFLFAFGLVFQLPLVFWFLGSLGVVSTGFLRRNRKFALLIIIIFAAILTPPDIFSQVLMAIPLMVLYEMGIFLVYLTGRRRARREMRQAST